MRTCRSCSAGSMCTSLAADLERVVDDQVAHLDDRRHLGRLRLAGHVHRELGRILGHDLDVRRVRHVGQERADAVLGAVALVDAVQHLGPRGGHRPHRQGRGELDVLDGLVVGRVRPWPPPARAPRWRAAGTGACGPAARAPCRSASSSSRNAATRTRGTLRCSVNASAMASSGTRSSFTMISTNDPRALARRGPGRGGAGCRMRDRTDAAAIRAVWTWLPPVPPVEVTGRPKDRTPRRCIGTNPGRKLRVSWSARLLK